MMLVIFLLAVSPVLASSNAWKSNGASEYSLFTRPMNFFWATKYCQVMGGSLAKPDTKAENLFLTNMLAAVNISKAPRTNNGAWIGARRLLGRFASSPEKQLRWLDQAENDNTAFNLIFSQYYSPNFTACLNTSFVQPGCCTVGVNCLLSRTITELPIHHFTYKRCVSMATTRNEQVGAWMFSDCHDGRPFICERNLPTTTSTVSPLTTTSV
eukprot:m.221506 g.221506  ORF g.221506 m.221506 type:complete len:212 (-) comp15818_c0_seq1:242-877(-)